MPSFPLDVVSASAAVHCGKADDVHLRTGDNPPAHALVSLRLCHRLHSIQAKHSPGVPSQRPTRRERTGVQDGKRDRRLHPDACPRGVLSWGSLRAPLRHPAHRYAEPILRSQIMLPACASSCSPAQTQPHLPILLRTPPTRMSPGCPSKSPVSVESTASRRLSSATRAG